MSRNLLMAFGIGIVCIAIAVAAVFYMQRGAHVDVKGSILKVRTAPADENSSFVAIDFRAANPADYPFMVRNVTVILEDNKGGETEGHTATAEESGRILQGIPLLGPKYNDALVERDKIPPHSTADRMVVAKFDVPEAQLQSRKQFVLKLEEMDGPVSQISEK
jgi:hypothetical protein